MRSTADDNPTLSVAPVAMGQAEGVRPLPAPENPVMVQLGILRGYLDLVERYRALADDPEATGVAAAIQAKEMLKGRGADETAEYLLSVLPEVKLPTVERAIRMQLAELYKESGQQEKALEQLRLLMTKVE